MVFQGINLTRQQPAATELTRRDNTADTRLHNHCIGI